METFKEYILFICGATVTFCAWIVRELHQRPTKEETLFLIQSQIKELHVVTNDLKEDIMELKEIIKENNHELRRLSETLASLNPRK